VTTFMMAREVSRGRTPEIGVRIRITRFASPGRSTEARKLAKINTYHVKLFAYFLDKLQSTPDGARLAGSIIQ